MIDTPRRRELMRRTKAELVDTYMGLEERFQRYVDSIRLRKDIARQRRPLARLGSLLRSIARRGGNK